MAKHLRLKSSASSPRTTSSGTGGGNFNWNSYERFRLKEGKGSRDYHKKKVPWTWLLPSPHPSTASSQPTSQEPRSRHSRYQSWNYNLSSEYGLPPAPSRKRCLALPCGHRHEHLLFVLKFRNLRFCMSLTFRPKYCRLSNPSPKEWETKRNR